MQQNLKNSGRDNFFEVVKDGREILNHSDSNNSNSNHYYFTDIKPTNQQDSSDYCLLHQIMSCDSHHPQASTNYTIAQASTFSTRTVSRNFTYGKSVLLNSHDPKDNTNSTTTQSSTFSTITVQRKFTYGTKFPSYPPPPSNGQSSPSSITPTGNYTPRNNPPKPVPHVPIEPDSDPSFPDYSSLDSSDSSDSGYSKQRRRTRKKRWSKMHNNDPIKKCAKLTYKLLKSAYNSKVERFKLDEDPL